MTPGLDSYLAGGSGIAIAVILYLLSYLSLVRILKYPRNWLRPGLAASMPVLGFTLALVAHVSLSSDGLDGHALWVSIAFIAVLFYVIAAPV